MTDRDALLAAYDALRPWLPADPQPGLTYEQRGSVLRVVGQHRGFIDTARDVGAQGEALDSLISEQRDFFTQRGEAVEWKTRGHDEPPDLPARLLAAGFVPEERETVVIGRAEKMAVEPMLPDGVTLRQVHGPSDFARIAAMESAVWDDDFSWVTQDLQSRVQAAPDEIVVHPAQARLPGGHNDHSLRMDPQHHGLTARGVPESDRRADGPLCGRSGPLGDRGGHALKQSVDAFSDRLPGGVELSLTGPSGGFQGGQHRDEVRGEAVEHWLPDVLGVGGKHDVVYGDIYPGLGEGSHLAAVGCPARRSAYELTVMEPE